MLSGAGCATDKARIEAAARQTAEAGLVARAIEESGKLPAWPDDCRKHERSGVRAGDSVEVVARLGDAAIGRGNARIDRCAAFYEALRSEAGAPMEATK